MGMIEHGAFMSWGPLIAMGLALAIAFIIWAIGEAAEG
ncbi:MAG: hypothetical protein QOF51_3187 [Chloroflexota bacterium]|jgi:hypothetical protein|nr:hypothetical protein [Chloroflexota bacterium]